jgi:hypothetical protein
MIYFKEIMITKEKVEQFIKDEKLDYSLPYSGQHLEKCMKHGYNLAQEEIINAIFTSLDENMKGYNIAGIVRGAILDSELKTLKEKMKKQFLEEKKED